MQVIDAISEVMKREGVEFLSCYPTSPIIEAAAVAHTHTDTHTYRHTHTVRERKTHTH